MSSTSTSFVAPAQRPLGLIVIVLIIDLALAGAGAALLAKGLASSAEPPTTAPAEQKTEVPIAPAPSTTHAAVEPPARAIDAPAPATKQEPVPAAARRTPAEDKPPDQRKQPEPKRAPIKPDTKPKPEPNRASTEPDTNSKHVDSVPAVVPQNADQPPATEPTTAREIDAQARRSQGAFERCATTHEATHGAIEVAFQVRGDGTIAHAAAVANTTGNDELARCLVAEISKWRVSAHGGEAINMVRPFTYP